MSTLNTRSIAELADQAGSNTINERSRPMPILDNIVSFLVCDEETGCIIDVAAFEKRHGRYPSDDEVRTVSKFEKSEIIHTTTFQPYGKENRCYDNCARLEMLHGGEAIDGWRFIVKPWGNTWGILEISAHTIWRSPDGIYYDPTPLRDFGCRLLDMDGAPFVIDDLSFVSYQMAFPRSNNRELKEKCRRMVAKANKECDFLFQGTEEQRRQRAADMRMTDRQCVRQAKTT